MPQVSEHFFKAAAVLLVITIMMGLQMSISGDHTAMSAHAHLGLLGWVASAAFGAYYALAPKKAASRLARVHFWVILVSSAVMTVALYLLLIGYDAMEPLVAAGSLLYFLGCLLFAWIVFSPTIEQGHSRTGATAG